MDRLLSEKTRSFVFQHVDSVELLEILLHLHADPAKSWTAQALAAEFRSIQSSVERRIAVLKKLELIQDDPSSAGAVHFHTNRPDQKKVVEELSQAYRIRRHWILEIIFAPSKRARDLADAFKVGQKGKNGDRRG